MFTGLIQHVGALQRLTPIASGGARLSIALGPLAKANALGDSIAIDGCCLTLAALNGQFGEFDAVPETLRRTTLGGMQPGARVNLEGALRPDSKLGGHFVQGHVDGTATVLETHQGERWGEWHFKLDNPELSEQIVEKGSIAVDGISLTVAGCSPQNGSFWVALIPETLARTTLGAKTGGQRVNIESDILGKYVLAALKARTVTPSAKPSRITEEFLREQGYLK